MIIWKPVTCQRMTWKNTRLWWVDSWARNTIRWYWSADTMFCQLPIDHNIDVQSVFSWAPKLTRKCESKHRFACGADGTVTWLPNFLGWVDLRSRFANLSVSRHVRPKPLTFSSFFLLVFVVLCFQCGRCFVFSVSRKYFSVLRSVNYRNLHFVSAFQFTTFNHQQVPNWRIDNLFS